MKSREQYLEYLSKKKNNSNAKKGYGSLCEGGSKPSKKVNNTVRSERIYRRSN